MNLDEKKQFLVNCAYFFVWILIIISFFKITAIYLLPFLIGVIIAYTVQKPSSFLSKKIKIKKETFSAVLSVLFYIIVILIILLFVWVLYRQSDRLIKYFAGSGVVSQIIDKIVGFLSTYFENFDSNFGNTVKKFTDQTENTLILKVSTVLSNTLANFVKKFPNLIFSFVITIVSTCYIAKDFDRLKKFVIGIVNRNYFKKIIEIKDVLFECFFKFIVGYFWLYLITFSILFIGFMISGVKNFIVLAFLISIIDLLPVLGTGIFLLPWSIFEFFQNDYKKGIGLILIYFVIIIVRNFFEPKIIGKQIGINPIFTLLFIFLGLRIGGVFGMITFPVIFTVLFSYYRQQFYADN